MRSQNRADLYTGGLYDRTMFQRKRHPKSKPKAVIADMDGTLVNVESIRHYVLRPSGEKDFDAFHAASVDCPPHAQAIEYCEKKFRNGYAILVVTARMQKHLPTTLEWLKRNMTVPFDGPFHAREDGDRRADVMLKRRLYDYLSRSYSIRGAIDDRPEVIAMWKTLGLEVEIVPGWLEDDASS